VVSTIGKITINGWLNIDKPAGLSSAAVVARVKHATGARKAGHGGTLDPLATGVLPIALGEATKTVAYVMDGTKAYRFTARWGEARSTDDLEGEVTETSEKRPSAAEIKAVLSEFEGEISQVPPVYSAIKVAGRRAYSLAREGNPPELAARSVRVDRLSMLSNGPDWAEFEVECGKGTYVRSLARDLARRLGSVGHIIVLRRTKAAGFSEKTAISLDSVAELSHSARLVEALLPVETALADIPALALTGIDANRLRRGQCVQVSGTEDGTVCVMADGRAVALARVAGGEVQPVRVFNL
jgi:tRNA pseudouridine55 synthase